MANTRTITAANSIVMLSIDGLYPAPQQLQGFAVDDIFEFPAVEPAEVMLGADGYMSIGWLPTIKKMGVTLQADSLSCDIFDQWNRAQEIQQESYVANGVVILISQQKTFTLARGALTSYKPLSDAKKVTQPRKFEITWNSVVQGLVV